MEHEIQIADLSRLEESLQDTTATMLEPWQEVPEADYGYLMIGLIIPGGLFIAFLLIAAWQYLGIEHD